MRSRIGSSRVLGIWPLSDECQSPFLPYDELNAIEAEPPRPKDPKESNAPWGISATVFVEIQMHGASGELLNLSVHQLLHV